MFLVFNFFVVIPGHNLGNSQVSVYRTIGPTLVYHFDSDPRFPLFYYMLGGNLGSLFYVDVSVMD